MHWGQENLDEPAPKYRRLAREAIAAGATVVVGHHPHVLQGTERVGAGAVAYSLGNFTFSEQDWEGTSRDGEAFSMPYRLSELNRRSAVWKVLIDPNKGVIDERLIPVYLGRDLIPVADARLGERNCLCLVPRPGEPLSLESLVAFLGDSVATYKLPERLELFRQFPFTPTGKIQRHALVREVVARMSASGAFSGKVAIGFPSENATNEKSN